MKYRFFAFFSAVFLALNCIFISSIPVRASGGGGQRFDMSEWNDWSVEQKFIYYCNNITGFLAEVIGVVVPYDYFEGYYDHFYNVIWNYVSPDNEILDTEVAQEWVVSNIEYDEEEEELLVSDALADVMYETCCDYIEEHCGWYEVETVDYRQYPASMFSTQGLYNAYLSYCTQNLKGTDNIIIVGSESSGDITGDDGVTHTGLRYALSQSLEGVEFYVKQYNETDGCIDAYMTQEWNTIAPMYGYLFTDGGYVPNHWAGGTIQNARFYPNDWYNRRPVTDGVRIVRVYKTLEDLKSYSVGQRPYFTTSKFQDYDVNGDNSCIISESELNGSSVYGDVINYIIDYPDADGLTEDELRRILDEYFNKLPDGGGSDGGDSGGGFGDGLGGFLDGIGAIGDAILGILGKLLEYIGKAIELLSDTVMKVVDLIPKNITALISGLFPFLPQEWLTAIELSLVLAVIVGIVGIFKK